MPGARNRAVTAPGFCSTTASARRPGHSFLGATPPVTHTCCIVWLCSEVLARFGCVWPLRLEDFTLLSPWFGSGVGDRPFHLVYRKELVEKKPERVKFDVFDFVGHEQHEPCARMTHTRDQCGWLESSKAERFFHCGSGAHSRAMMLSCHGVWEHHGGHESEDVPL